MKIINARKLKENIKILIAEIEMYALDGNERSQLIDASMMATLFVLIRLTDESEERFINDEMKELKEKMLRLEGEFAKIKRDSEHP